MMPSKFEEVTLRLTAQLQKNDSLPTRRDQQEFVMTSFVLIHKQYEAKNIDFQQYTNLINRLAAYKRGIFSDYIDMLVGAAHVGMLDIVIGASKRRDVAALAEANSELVTDMFGIMPSPIIGNDDETKL